MKLKMQGRWTIDQARKELNEHLDKLERMGIEEFTGLNFYYNPWVDGNEVCIKSDEGKVIDGYLVKAPKPAKEITDKPDNVVKLAVNNG